ncbi:MAG: methyltransferase, partial [Aquificota bacterium]|nr:methyltransferase [Aquificota bacterium]
MGNLDLTRDQIFSGKLVVFQPREGYRFSIEALLLAGFVRVRPRALVMDLGAGCGIISVTLALRFPLAKMVSLEIQERLSRALILTVRENHLEDRVLPVRGDLRSIPFKGERFDVVVANPPFKPPTAGRLPPDRENLLARTETLANLEDFLKAAYALLRPGGRVFLVYSTL